MDVRSGLITSVQAGILTLYSARFYREDIVSGLLEGTTITVWFLILDTLSSRSLCARVVTATFIS